MGKKTKVKRQNCLFDHFSLFTFHFLLCFLEVTRPIESHKSIIHRINPFNLRVMKNTTLYLLVFLLTLWGCSSRFYNRVIKYDDEFRNSSKTIVRLNLWNAEKRNEVRDAAIVFEKLEGMTGEQADSWAYFVITRTTTSFGITDRGYMKAGAQKFEFEIEEPVSEYNTSYQSTVMETEKADSTGYSSYMMASTSSNNWLEEKFRIMLTPDMVTAIGSADQVVFRFYFGPIPSTFILEGKKLELLKEVYGDKGLDRSSVKARN